MTAPNKEVFKNNASTTLNGAINNSVTSITATSGAVFPSTGNFRIIIDTEIMIVTARSSDTLTVERGAEGSSAASHSDLAPMTHIVTEGGVNTLGRDNDAMWNSNRPALGKLVADNGTTILTASDFTDVNFTDGTKTDQNGTIVLRHATHGASEDVCLLTRTAPSAPYSYIVAMQALIIAKDDNTYSHAGVCFRENSSGKFYSFGIARQSTNSQNLVIYKFNSATSYDSDLVSPKRFVSIGEYLWLKLEDDNTNLKFYVSVDGIEWILFTSVARTSFFTSAPDEIGFVHNVNGNDTHESYSRLCHWSRAS